MCSDYSISFTDGEDLIGFHLFEALDFLRGGPLHFDRIDQLVISQPEMKPQVILRHDAGAALHFSHLDVLTNDHSRACADSGSIAFRTDKLQLDPVLLFPSDVVQQRREIVHVEDQDVHASVIVVVAECGTTARIAFGDSRAHRGRDVFETPVAEILVDEAWVLEGLAEVVLIDLGVDVPVYLNNVGPSVVVVVDESTSPPNLGAVDSQA